MTPRRGQPTDARGQSNVVGVALMLAVTVVALGGLTASVGTVLQESAATADADRAATDLDDALDAVETTGSHRGRLSLTDGTVTVEQRELRVLDASGVVATVPVDALVVETGSQRAVYQAGAILRDTGAGSHLYEPPPVTASSGDGGVLVVGAPVLNASGERVVAAGGTTVVLDTDVTHDRTRLGNSTYSVAVETTAPDAWRRHFRRQGATISATVDYDGDGVDSVVARFEGTRTGYLVVHDMRLEVHTRG
jgi:flagellin-like protein